MIGSALTIDRHIDASPGVRDGKPRIAGRGITVQNIAIWHEWLGRTADEICSEHGLRLPEVYAALAYYHDHRLEIDAQIAADGAFVEALHRVTPSKLEAKLKSSPGE